MINIYTPREIGIVGEGGKILGGVLQKTLMKVVAGVTTAELDKYAEELILAAGAKPSFKMEKGYNFATCICVNDMVVHGIPSEYKLQSGDILGVDAGVYYKGFHSDASWTVQVGKGQNKFLEVGELALRRAIEACLIGNHIGDISKAIQDTIEKAEYSCVKQLVGHGVGRKLHEDPEVPCYLRGKIEKTPVIKRGMVLAIEVIYNQGSSPVIYANSDGWTIVTRDGSLSGLFEHTVAVTDRGVRVLTRA